MWNFYWGNIFSCIMNKIKSRDGRNSSVQYSIDKILKTQILKWKNPNRYRNSKITEEVIRRSVRKLKNNKTTRSDNIKAEIRKESKDISARLLHTLFNKVWEEEKVPEQWKIVKFPKKGGLTQCINWRGITLLSVAGKIRLDKMKPSLLYLNAKTLQMI